MSDLHFLLCTDLDRTLLPNGAQPESPAARAGFARLAARPQVTLAYVSGRDRELVKQAVADYRLPLPDFVIGDVGSSIYDLRDGQWTLWPDWQKEIAPDWRSLEQADLKAMLDDLDGLRLQENSKQNTFKLSYYVASDADRKLLGGQIAQRLEARDIAANLIWSIDETSDTGLLDLLPKRANKLHAIEFLREKLGISLSNTLFAGDSGNDLEVLSSPLPAVLVANATDVVRQQAIDEATVQNNRHALYLAHGDRYGMNGNYSAGILEGFAHYHPDFTDWFLDGADQQHEA
ncbi:MAG: HAD-IIB family hydrolase [Gammaproteobacteria bacterium]|nr:HAD-IIB family hydrolase [Gammaproteobacteria bacterium]